MKAIILSPLTGFHSGAAKEHLQFKLFQSGEFLDSYTKIINLLSNVLMSAAH